MINTPSKIQGHFQMPTRTIGSCTSMGAFGLQRTAQAPAHPQSIHERRPLTQSKHSWVALVCALRHPHLWVKLKGADHSTTKETCKHGLGGVWTQVTSALQR